MSLAQTTDTPTERRREAALRLLRRGQAADRRDVEAQEDGQAARVVVRLVIVRPGATLGLTRTGTPPAWLWKSLSREVVWPVEPVPCRTAAVPRHARS